MQLFKFTSSQIVQLEGEDGLASQNFQVGARCGASTIVSIELGALGVVIRRADIDGQVFKDLVITSPGIGVLQDKVRSEPVQLKAAREGR